MATGEDAERFAIGDRVISCFTPEWIDGLRAGTARTPVYRTLGGFFAGVLADYVVLPDHWLVAAPETLDDAQASTFPCAALTAFTCRMRQLMERGAVVVDLIEEGGLRRHLHDVDARRVEGLRSADAERDAARGDDGFGNRHDLAFRQCDRLWREISRQAVALATLNTVKRLRNGTALASPLVSVARNFSASGTKRSA